MESFFNYLVDHPEVIIAVISALGSCFSIIFSCIKLRTKRICKICNLEIDNLSELVKHKIYCELLQQGGQKTNESEKAQ